MIKKIPCAVLGCTGIVGQQFVRLLADHPFFEIVLLGASPRSAGRRYASVQDDAGEEPAAEMIVSGVEAEGVAASGARLAFVALPTAVAGPLESELRGRGLAVFTNASSHRMDDDVPLVVPEVNGAHLSLVEKQRQKGAGFIVTNSNCTASGLVMALKPLLELGLRAVTVSTYQALSGAGRRGVGGWDALGNVIPYIPQEEEKVERESRRMLGTLGGAGVVPLPLDFFVSCSRVPVLDGHLQSVTVELEDEVEEAGFRLALSSFGGLPQELALPTAPQPPILVREEVDRPQPRLDCLAGSPARARGMAVTVGRIRKRGKRFSFYLLVHNLIRGAAGCCVLNAELAARQGYLGLRGGER